MAGSKTQQRGQCSERSLEESYHAILQITLVFGLRQKLMAATNTTLSPYTWSRAFSVLGYSGLKVGYCLSTTYCHIIYSIGHY